ncbi:hypothetical protein [Sinomonas albida]|uniref:hypothetical protein n=1 Tax=Sinomonas albida TaxID=369942 RepID=UPI003019894A
MEGKTSFPWWQSLLSSVLSSLLASTIWAAVILWITARHIHVVHEWETLDHFPWDEYIRNAAEIEVNVHGWDGLFKGKNGDGGKREESWRSFFSKEETKLTLVLPLIPGEPGYVHEIHGVNLSAIQLRTGKPTIDDQIAEIRETISAAERLANDGPDRVNVKWVDNLRWICTVKFDKHSVVLSPYTAQSSRGHFEGPVFEVDPTAYPFLATWVRGLHTKDSPSNGRGGNVANDG